MERKLFRTRDLCIILPFLAIALFLAIHFSAASASAPIAVVENDGTEFCRINLSQISSTYVVEVGGPMNVKLLAEPGTISFLSSDCPDQICVRTGKLTKVGQTAVCLPGKVSVRIISGSSSGNVDVYTG